MTGLVASVVYHVALGMALAGVVWLTGSGYVRLLDGAGLRIRRVAHGYPFGLLAVTVASFLLLLAPPAGAVGLLLVVVPAAVAVRDLRVFAARVRRALAPLVWAMPPAVALAVALGLLLHGPTERFGSHAFGDLVYYVARLTSAGESVVPFRDLLVEGERSPYVEAGSSFIGAALARLPGVDPFLFQTSTMPAFLVASLAFGLATLPSPRTIVPTDVLALALLAVGVTAYPTWLAESPPIALALPLAFSAYTVSREPVDFRAFLVLAGAVALALALTKALGVIPLTVLLVVLLARYRLTVRQAALLLAAALSLGAVAVVAFFRTSGWLAESTYVEFLPADAVRGIERQFSTRDTQAAAPALLVVGQVALALAVLRSRSYGLFAVVAVSVAAHWLVGGQTVDVAVGFAVLLAVLHFWTRPDLLAAQRSLVLAAGAAIALAASFREVYGARSGFVLTLLLAGAVAGLLLGAAGEASRRRVVYAYALAVVASGALVGLSGRTFLAFAGVAVLVALPLVLDRFGRGAARLALPAAAGLAILLAGGAAVGAAARDDLRLVSTPAILTPAHYRLWSRVRDLVPERGLIFTSMTGPDIEADEGWNFYPGIAGRQLYLGGWANSRLVRRPGERERRLRLNRMVLTGAMAATRVALGDAHDEFFAVLRRHEPAPPDFRRIHADTRFAVYRIRR